MGPCWDGWTSRSSTAHVGHHVQPLRRLAHLRTVRLGVAFATSSRWHLPSWWYMTPHIIRDRAGAIRPDFSVCVENSCMLIGRTLSVIVAFLFTPGKRKGSCGPLLRLSGKTDRGNLRWWMLPLLGLTRCELVWLAQNALRISHCTGDLFRTDVPSYLFLSGGSHLITQRLASRSA